MSRIESKSRAERAGSPHRPSAGFNRATSAPARRARGRRGESLASARDRERLHERNTAERERVERMLASVPVAVDRRSRARVEPASLYEHPTLRAMQPEGCPVCGDGRVATDEVMHGGTLRVSECLHCEHRWTERPRARWVELGARMTRDSRAQAASAH